MDENKWKKIAIIFIVFFIICAGLLDYKSYTLNKIEQEDNWVELEWACMDGCYNMLEVIYGEVKYENKTLESFHTICSDTCFEQYYPDKLPISDETGSCGLKDKKGDRS